MEELIAAAIGIRALWRKVLTPTGRPTTRPTWIAVAVCERCGHSRITSSEQEKGRRWTCPDYGGMGTTNYNYYGPLRCGGFLRPEWWDGPLPDVEDAREEQADFLTSKKRGYASD